MQKRVINKASIKRAAIRSTQASALLERRVVPAEFVRSKKTERYLAERRKQN